MNNDVKFLLNALKEVITDNIPALEGLGRMARRLEAINGIAKEYIDVIESQEIEEKPGNKLTLKFETPEDLKAFRQYHGECKKSAHTITGLSAGLGCSALRKSKELNAPESKPVKKWPDYNYPTIDSPMNGTATGDDVQSIFVLGRQRMDKNGNTKYTCKIYINGTFAGKTYPEYGYGNQYFYGAFEWLEKHGVIEPRHRFERDGQKRIEQYSEYCERHNIAIDGDIFTVNKLSDL